MLGDTAVAVNPKDPRYKDKIGKMLKLPLTDREIPLIADDYCEMDFGTGAVKITPAHDPNDFEIGIRHNLQQIRVIADDGTMNENAGIYAGLDRLECRKRVVEDLKAQGYLEKIEPYAHKVGTCYRCHETVESIVSRQWFVKMKPLAEPAIKAVKTKKIEFVPKHFEKTYFNWMENIKDWCISRQLWWGHRIPAYYCDQCGEMYVAKTMPTQCKCGCTSFKQDEDALDTWFSSALWPFSTLGYPKKNKNLSYYYPTSVLVTGYDIIFFWVARMIFSGLEFMEDVPFSEVLIHGIVRDEKGRKMSKSLGNGIDPLELIDKYGADALRFSLTTNIAPGSDTRFSKEKLESCRNFCNKLWNASRFVIMNIKKGDELDIIPTRLNIADKWILTRLNQVIKEVTINLNSYDIGVAAAKLYDFTWSEFCDWYIEVSKPALYSNDENQRKHAISMLTFVLTTILKLLHPIIPFITEEIYSKYHKKGESIMVQDWPSYNRKYVFHKEEKAFEDLIELVTSIRNTRASMNVVPSKKIHIQVLTEDTRLFKQVETYLDKLAGVESVVYLANGDEADKRAVALVTAIAQAYIPMGELIDPAKEKERLEKELAQAEGDIEHSQRLLDNTGFVSRAPQKVIDTEKAKLEAAKDKYNKIKEQLDALK